MSPNRREFLRTGGTIFAAGLVLPRRPSSARAPLVFEQADLKALAAAALEAARGAGAGYTEVRLSEYRRKDLNSGSGWGGGPAGTTFSQVYGTQTDGLGLGVRALVDGAWGFASGILWTVDDATRLGRQAVIQAKTMRQPGMPPVELAPVPVVRDGTWVMPVERDPFEVSREEIIDVLSGASFYTARRWGHPMLQVTFHRWETAFATSDGTFLTQKRYGTEGHLGVGLRPVPPVGVWSAPMAMQRLLPLAGRGWEYIAKAPMHEHIEWLREDAESFNALPLRTLEVGRYDTVLDAATTARILSSTIGSATELDRAFGYEANAGGTSYLNDPLTMLGAESVAAPSVTITANRSLVQGMATVKWDDEGVVPEEFTLVKGGVLADYQTTRESVTWLKDGYARLNRPVRSNGCAGSATAHDITLSIRPNLRLAPGRDATTLESLKAGLVNGILIEQAFPDVDFNGLNGMAMVDRDLGVTRFTEIKRGKRTGRFGAGAVAMLFRAPELWRGVTQLGGSASMRATPVSSRKGEPSQETFHTVESPPLLLKQASIIDPTR
jgi:TldD protein